VRLLVAGATGVLGRALLPLLAERGHDVISLVRSPTPGHVVVADALDRDGVVAAVRAAAPDVVVHQLSALRSPSAFEKTARLRTEGTENLLTAARAAGVRRFVAQSIAFATAPEGPAVLDEDARLYTDAPDEGWARTVRAVARLEELTLGASGIVLRCGTLYGPGTQYAPDGSVGAALAKGRFRLPEEATGRTSFVHAADAAHATALAVESEVTGRFTITDDEPVTGAEWVPRLAGLLGGPPPRTIPADMARRLLGWFPTYQLTALRGASNERARRVLGWKPLYSQWQAGMAHP
jgi:nucleoside-diphosphate-sugar epimerase